MTNGELLQRVRPILSLLTQGSTEDHDFDYDGANTTAIRYAAIENEKRMADALESYNERLRELTQEHEADLENLESSPQEFRDELQELLDRDAPFEPYTITDDELKAEDDVPLEVLASLDWMIG